MWITTFFQAIILPLLSSEFMSFCEEAAPLSSVLVFLAPIPTMRIIWKNKTVGDLPLITYTVMVMNAFLWLMYGFLKGEPKIWTSNCIGFFAGWFYFLEFVRYADDATPPTTTTPTKSTSSSKSSTLPGTITQHFQCCFLAIITTLLLSIYDPSGQIIGNVAVTSCIVMFASPLAALPTVLHTKSAQSIPFPYTIAVLANSIFWIFVGLFDMHDKNIYIPSWIGLLLSSIQLYLKFKYGDGGGPRHRHRHHPDEDEKVVVTNYNDNNNYNNCHHEPNKAGMDKRNSQGDEDDYISLFSSHDLPPAPFQDEIIYPPKVVASKRIVQHYHSHQQHLQQQRQQQSHQHHYNPKQHYRPIPSHNDDDFYDDEEEEYQPKRKVKNHHHHHRNQQQQQYPTHNHPTPTTTATTVPLILEPPFRKATTTHVSLL